MSRPAAFFSTAVPGLDDVLGGGFIPGSLVFLVGPPGAGKTIMASQILFGAAQRGLKTLILTTFSEGSVKLVNHLRHLQFFDDALIGDRVTILSLPSVLSDDMTEAAGRIVQTIRQTDARIVMLDGFQGVAGLLGAGHTVRQTLADLANLLSFLDVVVVVTLEGQGRDLAASGAITTADAVLSLQYHVADNRHVRHLDVVKQRGTAPFPGLHAYSIDDTGITVFPRLEAIPLPPPPAFASGRAPFGLPELDDVLRGGLTTHTTTLLAGAPGVGKTTLGMFWVLNNATPEAPALFVSFGEYPDQLQWKAAAFGLDLEAKVATGALHLLRLSPIDIVPDIVANVILGALPPNTSCLVIDDMAGLMYALAERGGMFLGALAAHTYSRGVTSVFMLEIEAMAGLRLRVMNSPLALMAESIILLQHIVADGRLRRMLAVIKMRYSDFDQSLREVVLDAGGVGVLPPPPVASNVLPGAVTDGDAAPEPVP